MAVIASRITPIMHHPTTIKLRSTFLNKISFARPQSHFTEHYHYQTPRGVDPNLQHHLDPNLAPAKS